MYRIMFILPFLGLFFLSCYVPKTLKWSLEIIERCVEISDITLITDALVFRTKNDGTTYPAKLNSDLSSQNLNKAIAFALEKKNYTIIDSFYNFSGTFCPIDTLSNHLTDSLRNCGVILPPFSLDTTIFIKEKNIQSFLWLSRRIYEFHISKSDVLDSNFIKKDSLAQIYVKNIKERIKTNYLLLTFFYGSYYSHAEVNKQHAANIIASATTFLFSLLLPVTIFTIPGKPIPARFYCFSTFIDLDNFDILWYNSTTGSSAMMHSFSLMNKLTNNYLLKNFPPSTNSKIP